MNNNNSNRIVNRSIQVGQSYVLPIEQSRVTQQQAKVNKIIEETDAKAQGIIDNAENQADVVVQTANIEAQRIIEDARRKAEQEAEMIKEQAYREGFEKGKADGLVSFQEDAQDVITSLDILANASFEEKNNIIDSATIDMVELVAAIADKVCHAKFDNKILEKLTVESIKLLSEKESITIIVNPTLVDKINSMVNGFKSQIRALEQVKIIEDSSVSPDGVIVETLSTRLDSRISAQIGEIAHNMLTGSNNEMG